ncbi:MAG: glycerol-3-phosphate 1-O-acyltransferase PlsY [Chloroflexi bacterium]|nr:glycerol-3-phosphate 1-O-acyltransferase PlsY [Chloroflexota bacterium]
MEVLLLLASYLLGSVPSGQWLARLRGLDLREHGSGRTGATNVLRTLGPGPAALVLAVDMGKGALPVALARWLAPGSPWLEVATPLMAVVGHNWSLYLGFQGGRGVAAGLGGALMLSAPAAGVAVATFALAVALTRYVSLGSMLAAVALAAALGALFWVGQETLAHLAYGLVAAPLIVFQHRDNLQRLLNGTERKLGEPAPRQESSSR